MSTCRDCYHFEACMTLSKTNKEYGALSKCHLFKDKSKIVELPCEVGDKVFVVRSATSNGDNLYILEDVVKRIITEKATDINAIWTRVEFKNITSLFEWEFSNIFLTKEEAEKALENIKNKGEI